jgi:hypothetical protein
MALSAINKRLQRTRLRVGSSKLKWSLRGIARRRSISVFGVFLFWEDSR